MRLYESGALPSSSPRGLTCGSPTCRPSRSRTLTSSSRRRGGRRRCSRYARDPAGAMAAAGADFERKVIDTAAPWVEWVGTAHIAPLAANPTTAEYRAVFDRLVGVLRKCNPAERALHVRTLSGALARAYEADGVTLERDGAFAASGSRAISTKSSPRPTGPCPPRRHRRAAARRRRRHGAARRRAAAGGGARAAQRVALRSLRVGRRAHEAALVQGVGVRHGAQQAAAAPRDRVGPRPLRSLHAPERRGRRGRAADDAGDVAESQRGDRESCRRRWWCRCRCSPLRRAENRLPTHAGGDTRAGGDRLAARALPPSALRETAARMCDGNLSYGRTGWRGEAGATEASGAAVLGTPEHRLFIGLLLGAAAAT